jgi:hypothetical protein
LLDGEGKHLIEFRKRELRTALGTAKWQVCVIAVEYFGSFPKYFKYVKYSI